MNEDPKLRVRYAGPYICDNCQVCQTSALCWLCGQYGRHLEDFQRIIGNAGIWSPQ